MHQERILNNKLRLQLSFARGKRIGNRCGGIDHCRYGDLCQQCVVNYQKETAPGKNLEQGIERLKEAAGQAMESRQ
jgi:hypothetical protein